MEIISSTPKAFNLIPRETLRHAERRRAQAASIVFITLLFAMITIVFAYVPDTSSLLETTAKDSSEIKSRLKPTQWLLLKNRVYFSDLLSHLAEKAHGKIILVTLSYSDSTRLLSLSGSGSSAEDISDFLKQFEKAAHIKNGKLTSLTSDHGTVAFQWQGTTTGVDSNAALNTPKGAKP